VWSVVGVVVLVVLVCVDLDADTEDVEVSEDVDAADDAAPTTIKPRLYAPHVPFVAAWLGGSPRCGLNRKTNLESVVIRLVFKLTNHSYSPSVVRLTFSGNC